MANVINDIYDGTMPTAVFIVCQNNNNNIKCVTDYFDMLDLYDKKGLGDDFLYINKHKVELSNGEMITIDSPVMSFYDYITTVLNLPISSGMNISLKIEKVFEKFKDFYKYFDDFVILGKYLTLFKGEYYKWPVLHKVKNKELYKMMGRIGFFTNYNPNYYYDYIYYSKGLSNYTISDLVKREFEYNEFMTGRRFAVLDIYLGRFDRIDLIANIVLDRYLVIRTYRSNYKPLNVVLDLGKPASGVLNAHTRILLINENNTFKYNIYIVGGKGKNEYKIAHSYENTKIVPENKVEKLFKLDKLANIGQVRE